MKQVQNKIYTIALAAIALLLFAGCTKKPSMEAVDGQESLSLTVDGAKVSVQGSRAVAVDESAISDLWVLQFQMTPGSSTVGTLVRKEYITGITDPSSIKLKSVIGTNMALYLVANSGMSTLFSSTADGTTLATVKATLLSFTSFAGTNFPADVSPSLPMVGLSATNLSLPIKTAISVDLTRLVAKIELTVKNLMETDFPKLKVSKVQLRAVPQSYMAQVVNTASGFDGSTAAKRYPTAPTTIDYTAISGDITEKGSSYTWYMAPNVRGKGTNTEPRLKTQTAAPTGQGDYCTYVEITATSQADATSLEVDVLYRLYLGENNTNDFNIQSNVVYKVGVVLEGMNTADARMNITTTRFDPLLGDLDGDHSMDNDDWDAPVVGGYRDGGIVFWVNPSNQRYDYKVIDLWAKDGGVDKPAAAWASQSNFITPAQSTTNGLGNTRAIWDFSLSAAGTRVVENDFPAAGKCINYKGQDNDPAGTWYLPAIEELNDLYKQWTAKDGAFKKALVARDVDINVVTNSRMWSSSEDLTTTTNALAVDFASGATVSHGKTANPSSRFRCIRHITPECKVGDYRDGGVVFSILHNDPTQYKVLSLYEEPGVAPPSMATFAGAANNSFTFGSDNTNGPANIKEMIDFSAKKAGGATGNFATDFPAAGYCYNYRGSTGLDPHGTWYLPSQFEMQDIYNAMQLGTITNQILASRENTIFANNAKYWTSTTSGSTNAIFVIANTSDATYNGNDSKTASYNVRCVRNIAKPILGDYRHGGLVFWIDTDNPMKYKVFSLDEQKSTLTPLVNQTYPAALNNTLSLGRSATNGARNTQDLITAAAGNFATNYPAAAYCYNYRGQSGLDPAGTWYLPASEELTLIFNRWKAGTLSNAIITASGGVAFEGASYWSSTEYALDDASAVTFNLNATVPVIHEPKTTPSHVRCIRAL